MAELNDPIFQSQLSEELHTAGKRVWVSPQFEAISLKAAETLCTSSNNDGGPSSSGC